MSQMDGVCDEVKLVKQAMAFGHAGIAITDHDCTQSFPHVFGEVTSYNKGLKKAAQAKIDDLKKSLEEIKETGNEEGIKELEKMILDAEEEKKNLKFFKAGYGAEIEMCESYLNVCYNANDDKIDDNTFVVFDTETTGFNPGIGDSMIEIGGVKVYNGEVVDRFDELINPGCHIDEAITRVTDISDDDVKDASNEKDVVTRFKEWIGDYPLVAHNATFDKNMLDMAYYKYNLGELKNPIIDTLMLSRVINRDLKKHSLKALGKFYGVDTGEADDEDEEQVNEGTGTNGSLIDEEIGSSFKSIKIDTNTFVDKDNLFEWPDLSNEIETDGYCYGLNSHIGILSDGTVIPCCLDANGVIELGNIFKEELKDILNKKISTEIVEGFKNNKAVHPLCKKCNFRERFIK